LTHEIILPWNLAPEFEFRTWERLYSELKRELVTGSSHSSCPLLKQVHRVSSAMSYENHMLLKPNTAHSLLGGLYNCICRAYCFCLSVKWHEEGNPCPYSKFQFTHHPLCTMVFAIDNSRTRSAMANCVYHDQILLRLDRENSMHQIWKYYTSDSLLYTYSIVSFFLLCMPPEVLAPIYIPHKKPSFNDKVWTINFLSLAFSELSTATSANG